MNKLNLVKYILLFQCIIIGSGAFRNVLCQLRTLRLAVVSHIKKAHSTNVQLSKGEWRHLVFTRTKLLPAHMWARTDRH